MMERLITRPRSLMLIVALAVIAAMCTVSTARGAPGSGATSRATVASGTPCSFIPTLTCQSTDASVALNIDYYGEQSGCTYVWDVDWGDSNSESFTVTDPADGYIFLANHAYSGAKTYTIAVTGQVTVGPCTANDFTAQFTLLPPAPSPRIHKSAHHCLGAAAFPLNDLCVTANYTVLGAHRLQISSVEICVDIQGPAATAIAKTEINIYSSGPKIWSSKKKALIYGPIGFDSQKCEWYWPWVIATPGKVGVWGGSAEGVFSLDGKEDIIPEEWVGVRNFR
jgi:hypothetical protein